MAQAHPGAALFPSTGGRSVSSRSILWDQPLTRTGLGNILPRRLEEVYDAGLIPRLEGSFASHSLRRGGSTWLGSRNAPEELQHLLGRWKTDVWRSYCDTPWDTLLRGLLDVA